MVSAASTKSVRAGGAFKWLSGTRKLANPLWVGGEGWVKQSHRKADQNPYAPVVSAILCPHALANNFSQPHSLARLLLAHKHMTIRPLKTGKVQHPPLLGLTPHHQVLPSVPWCSSLSNPESPLGSSPHSLHCVPNPPSALVSCPSPER